MLNWHLHNYNGDGTFSTPDDKQFYIDLMHITDERSRESKQMNQLVLDDEIPLFSCHDDKFMLKSINWLESHHIELTNGHSIPEVKLMLLLNSGTHDDED